MPRKLVKLKITEVASVDRGAGEGVRVLLTKRHKRTGSTMAKDSTLLEKARNAFMNSISSILGVSDDPAKVEDLIGKSTDQLMEHIAGVTGDKQADDLGGEIGKGDTMDPEVLKALGLADGASAADVLKAIDTLKAAKPKEDGGDNGNRQDDDKQKKAPDVVLPESVTKALAEAEVLKGEVAALKRAAELEAFTKKAVKIGLPASAGEILMKAYAGGGNEAVDKILGFLEAANAQAMEAGIFKEFGASVGDGPASALDELNTLATALRKADPKLSADQAFAKVYTDPANAKLAARERSENRPTIVASR